MTRIEPSRRDRVVKGTVRVIGTTPGKPPVPLSQPPSAVGPPSQTFISIPGQPPSYMQQQVSFMLPGTRKIPSQTTPSTFLDKEDDVYLHRMKVGRMVGVVFPFAVEDSESVRVSKACEKDKSFSPDPSNFAEVRCYYDDADLKKSMKGRDLDAETVPIYCGGINQWADMYDENGLGLNPKACKWTKRTEVDRMTPNETKSIALTNARLLRAAFNVALRKVSDSTAIFMPQNNLLPPEMAQGQIWLPTLPGG